MWDLRELRVIIIRLLHMIIIFLKKVQIIILLFGYGSVLVSEVPKKQNWASKPFLLRTWSQNWVYFLQNQTEWQYNSGSIYILILRKILTPYHITSIHARCVIWTEYWGIKRHYAHECSRDAHASLVVR